MRPSRLGGHSDRQPGSVCLSRQHHVIGRSRVAVKSKPGPKSTPSRTTSSFDFEHSPWFAPVAFAVIFVALVVLFRKFIFSDLMLYGSDTIQAGIFFRSMLVDFVGEYGTVPRWNPYIFGGLPYIEAFHGDIFYPLSFLKFFGDIFRMLGWILFLHIFLAGVFMYLAARQFKLSKIAALLAGVCYMFAPYLVSFVAPGHDGKIFVTTLFPLAMLFLDRGFERRSFLDFSLMGLVIGLIVLSPHPQMSYFTLWALALYTLFRLVLLYRETHSVAPLIRPAVLAVYGVVIGLLLSAIQFYPGYVYTNEFSPRADTKRGWEWAISWSMHTEEAMGLIVPEFPGSNSEGTQSFYWGKNMFKDNSEAVGAVTFFLALLGAFFAKRREAYFFAGLAIFALLYALADTTPVFQIFYHLIPKVKSLRAPAMIMFLFSFSAALLAGMGLQRLRDAYEKKEAEAPGKRFEWLLWGFPAFLFALALLFSAAGRGMLSLWTSIFYSEAATRQVQQGITKLDLAYRNLPTVQSGLWMAFVFVTLAAVCLWLYRSRRAGAMVLAGLVLVPVVDGIRFNGRFVATYDQQQMWGENAVTQFFAQQPAPYRVVDFGVLPANLLPYHQVEVVTGYHGNQLRWYDDLLGGPGAPNVTDKPNPRFLNLVGAEYILFPGSARMPEGYFGPAPVNPAASFGQFNVLRNENAFPRVFLVDRYQVIPDRNQITPKVLNGDDDLRRLAYLEKDPPLDIPRDSLSADSAWIVEHNPDTVIVGLRVAQNKLLVLTDNWYEAWQVYLDGQPAEVLRAYGSFRAVAIPAGTKAALFVYESERYQTGKLVTWLTTLFLGLVVGFYVVQNYRRRQQ